MPHWPFRGCGRTPEYGIHPQHFPFLKTERDLVFTYGRAVRRRADLGKAPATGGPRAARNGRARIRTEVQPNRRLPKHEENFIAEKQPDKRFTENFEQVRLHELISMFG